MDIMMLAAELALMKDEVASLKTALGRSTLVTGPNQPHMVKAKNSTGANCQMGDVVVATGFDNDLGMLTYGKPTEDNGRDVLGVVAHQTTSNEVGYVHVTGVCLCRWEMDAGTPAAGMPVGTQEDSHVAAVGNFSLGFFMEQVSSDMAMIVIDRTERLITDHRISNVPSATGHIESSGVYEPKDLLGNTVWVVGKLSDLFSVILVSTKSGSSWTTAIDFRYTAKHRHGWTYGQVIEEGGTGTDVGWGKLADVVGIREPGQSNLDINLFNCHFNSSKNTLLLGWQDEIEAVERGGVYTYGWMVPHEPSQTWRPAVPVQYELRTIHLSIPSYTETCDDEDRCRLLVDPLAYRKKGDDQITGPHDTSTSLCNYLEWIACNRHDINGIFHLLWYVSCCFSVKVGNMDSQLQSIIASGGWIDQYFIAVNALLAVLQAQHAPIGNPEMAAVNSAYAAIVWYTTVCALEPCGEDGILLDYLLECPYWGQQQ